MFGTPVQLPKGANILPFIWCYTVKNNGVRKARCVVNGSPCLKDSVTLGKTYAAALEQPGARMFWALSALHGNIITGADVSNAFAEADPPKPPFYVKVDQVFNNWWVNVKQRPPLPPGTVLPVCHALQGHPESPASGRIKLTQFYIL